MNYTEKQISVIDEKAGDIALNNMVMLNSPEYFEIWDKVAKELFSIEITEELSDYAKEIEAFIIEYKASYDAVAKEMGLASWNDFISEIAENYPKIDDAIFASEDAFSNLNIEV